MASYRYSRARYRRRRGRMSGRDGAVLAAIGGVVLAAAVHASGAAPASTAPITVPAAASCAAPDAVCTGQRMAAARGWTGAEWTCLDLLWARESNWSAYAANPTSDARGIPQNINGWSAYAPGDVPAQIRWGLGYVAGRYVTPCRAWAHEEQDGWY
jgi:resuscitation-promoting factor RpfB